MNVRILIEELQKVDPEMIVMIALSNGPLEAEYVWVIRNNDTECLCIFDGENWHGN